MITLAVFGSLNQLGFLKSMIFFLSVVAVYVRKLRYRFLSKISNLYILKSQSLSNDPKPLLGLTDMTCSPCQVCVCVCVCP